MNSELISVTSLATSVAFKLSTSKIVSFIGTNAGANCKITYIDDFENTLQTVEVSQTAVAINTACASTVAVTLVSPVGQVIYLNTIFFTVVSTTGTGATIKYDTKKIAFENIVVTQTPAAIQTAVNNLTVVPTFTSAVFSDPNVYANATGITAFATGGQASATALIEETNNVTVVATAGDSVKLPTAAAGLKITVKNSGATALDIFPFLADSIDALAVNLAVRIQPGSTAIFSAISATVWESNIDASFTLLAPTTLSGQLEIKAADSAGNTVTTITNASQAAARVYTIPDAGANASFVMTEGAETLNGVKTLTEGVVVATGVQVGSDTPTISKPSGIITTATTATVPQAYKTVVLTNTYVSATSKVFVSIGGYGGTGIPVVAQVTNTANTCTILILNAVDTGGANLSAAMDLCFFVVN